MHVCETPLCQFLPTRPYFKHPHLSAISTSTIGCFQVCEWVQVILSLTNKQTQQSINRKNKQKLSPTSIFNEFRVCGVCCDQTQIIRKVKHEQSLRRTKF